jgi:hypothetical protein
MTDNVVKTEIFDLKQENADLKRRLTIADMVIKMMQQRLAVMINAEEVRIGQSRMESFAEAVFNVSVGFVVAMATQLLVFPVFGIHIGISENILIGVIFTAVSIVRSYAVRRLFNWFGVKE